MSIYIYVYICLSQDLDIILFLYINKTVLPDEHPFISLGSLLCLMHSTLKAQCTASVGIVYTVTATQKEKLGLNAQASNISTSN